MVITWKSTEAVMWPEGYLAWKIKEHEPAVPSALSLQPSVCLWGRRLTSKYLSVKLQQHRSCMNILKMMHTHRKSLLDKHGMGYDVNIDVYRNVFPFFIFSDVCLFSLCGWSCRSEASRDIYQSYFPRERSQELFQPSFNQVCWLRANVHQRQQTARACAVSEVGLNTHTPRGYPPLSHMLGLWAAGFSGHQTTSAAA